jgi:F-box/WD-40 domain protein 7
MESLECVRVLEGHNEAVLALAVGPSFLVSGSYDTTVRFWALDTLRCVRRAFWASCRPAACCSGCL